MKKSVIICLAAVAAQLLVSCGKANHDGTYVSSWKNEFSAADDTIIIKEDIVTKRTGYRKIRNGRIMPKQWRLRRWMFNTPLRSGH